jgi:predicted ArsR family transcriptional regulator
MTPSEVAAALGLEMTAAAERLRRLRDKGLAHQPAYGQWMAGKAQHLVNLNPGSDAGEEEASC